MPCPKSWSGLPRPDWVRIDSGVSTMISNECRWADDQRWSSASSCVLIASQLVSKSPRDRRRTLALAHLDTVEMRCAETRWPRDSAADLLPVPGTSARCGGLSSERLLRFHRMRPRDLSPSVNAGASSVGVSLEPHRRRRRTDRWPARRRLAWSRDGERPRTLDRVSTTTRERSVSPARVPTAPATAALDTWAAAATRPPADTGSQYLGRCARTTILSCCCSSASSSVMSSAVMIPTSVSPSQTGSRRTPYSAIRSAAS